MVLNARWLLTKSHGFPCRLNFKLAIGLGTVGALGFIIAVLVFVYLSIKSKKKERERRRSHQKREDIYRIINSAVPL